MQKSVTWCLQFLRDLCRRSNTAVCSSLQKNKRVVWLPSVSVHALRPFQLDCAVLHPGLILCANSGSLSKPTPKPTVGSGSHCNRQSAVCPWAWRITRRLPTRASAGRGSWARKPGGSPNHIYLPWKERLKSLESICFSSQKIHFRNKSASHSMI